MSISSPDYTLTDLTSLIIIVTFDFKNKGDE